MSESIATHTTTQTADLPLARGRWVLDPFHSAIGFTARHLGISKVRGRFAEFDAELVVGATADDHRVVATVALDSIDTGNSDRDAHVRAPDMLDTVRRPTMTFRSTAMSGAGAEWTLQGELTIGTVTRQLALRVDFGGVQESIVDGRRHAGFEASGEIRRSDYGLTFGLGDAMIGDVVRIQLDAQFVEPAQPVPVAPGVSGGPAGRRPRRSPAGPRPR
jgi:polyisoprenoid-binding protein YceI